MISTPAVPSLFDFTDQMLKTTLIKAFDKFLKQDLGKNQLSPEMRGRDNLPPTPSPTHSPI